MLVKPPHLEFGDTVGIVAPASAPPDPRNIDQCVQAVEQLGFKPRLAPRARKRWGYLAGPDRDRASDLMNMFADPKVKGIFCIRGGYGTARLLPLLDYEFIRKHPKVFVGYSDITSLHCAFLVKSHMVCFHGPMLNSDFIKPNTPQFTIKTLLRAIMSTSTTGSLRNGNSAPSIEVLRPGTASGSLVGGNLSILCASLGTPYQPLFRNAILFFEDVDEVPYRFDRMLTQLINAGHLQKIAGIAIGINKNSRDPKAAKTKEYRQTLEDVFKERLLPLGIPVVTGLPFGHIAHNATLPLGTRAVLDGAKGDLILTEPAVS